jgi:hypothetical protein
MGGPPRRPAASTIFRVMAAIGAPIFAEAPEPSGTSSTLSCISQSMNRVCRFARGWLLQEESGMNDICLVLFSPANERVLAGLRTTKGLLKHCQAARSDIRD